MFLLTQIISSFSFSFLTLVTDESDNVDVALKAWKRREPFQLAQVLRSDLDTNDLYVSSMYSLYRRGDPVFETLLHSGSLLSLWHRLHGICRRGAVTGHEIIKWSVVRQAPRLNRCVRYILIL